MYRRGNFSTEALIIQKKQKHLIIMNQTVIKLI